MCVACNMGWTRQQGFKIEWGNWADTGPIVLVYLWRFAFSVGTQKVRPRLKPETTYDPGNYMSFGKHDTKVTSHQGRWRRSLMWGIFNFVIDGGRS